MKNFLKILFSILILIPTLACGIFNNDQNDVNQVTQGLALTGKTFVDFFEDNLDSCQDLVEVFNALEATTKPCDNDGNFVLNKTLESFSCQSDSPLQAQMELVLTQNNCKDQQTNLTSTGRIEIVLEFSSSGNFAILKSDGLLSQGKLFVFELPVRVDFATNSLSCSEAGDLQIIENPSLNEGIEKAEDLDLQIDEDPNSILRTCSIRSDCEKCLF
ncbi:MAG: hypothetical protein KDK66_04005 [Deltaproteobacteria bacterium]|nr:hypothetical protein [Deltaproteobacteria bacterium]